MNDPRDTAFLNYDEDDYYDELEKSFRSRFKQAGNTLGSNVRANTAIARTNQANQVKGALGGYAGGVLGGGAGAGLGYLAGGETGAAVGAGLGSLGGYFGGANLAQGGRKGRLASQKKTSAKLRSQGMISGRQQQALDRYNTAVQTKGVSNKDRSNAWLGVRNQYGYTGNVRSVGDRNRRRDQDGKFA